MLLLASVEKFVVEMRESRNMLLFIVWVALFLDNMLLTSVGTCECTLYGPVLTALFIGLAYVAKILPSGSDGQKCKANKYLFCSVDCARIPILSMAPKHRDALVG
jgi:hypothetical protein